MFHNILIALHTLTALLSLIVGAWLVYRLPKAEDERFLVYLGSLVLMVIFLFAAIVNDWSQLGTGSQAIFAALGLLALYMVVRGFQARQELQKQAAGWEARFIDHIGFTLISLFDGFMIVTFLDLNMSAPLVGLIAVAAVVIGIMLINSAKRRVA